MERLIRVQDGRTVAHSVLRAPTRMARVRGLLGQSSMVPGAALMLEPARQVHTMGMRFPIDVVFCDRELNVLHVIRSMRPQRLSRVVLRARSAIELEAGGAHGLSRGDRLAFSPASGSSDRSR